MSSFSAPCGSTLQGIIERESCGTFGCNWVERAVSARVPVNQRGWTFVEVHTTCRAGTTKYRAYTVVRSPSVGDGSSSSVKEARSNTTTYTC